MHTLIFDFLFFRKYILILKWRNKLLRVSTDQVPEGSFVLSCKILFSSPVLFKKQT